MSNSVSFEENRKDSPASDEIDIIELIKKVLINKKFVLRVVGIFMLLGILVAIFSPVEYTSSTIMVPQTGEQKFSNNLGGLAAMAGINVGNTNPEVLSSQIYPQIINSVPFQKEVMELVLDFNSYEDPIKVIDYFTDKKYQKFSLVDFIGKYTVGLPGLIVGSFRKKGDHIESTVTKNGILSIDQQEKKCIDEIRRRVTIIVDSKKDYVELEATMPDALAAAQLVQNVQVLLQKYITKFKLEKIQFNLDFIEERWEEARNEFERIQRERALFMDANKDLSKAKALTEREKLDADYNLSFTVYSELAKQLEQAKIQVKEGTPILTIIDPPTIPNQKTKPRRGFICIAFTFFGFIVGIGLVFFIPFLNSTFYNNKLNIIK